MDITKSLRMFLRPFEQAFRTYHAPFRIPAQPAPLRALSTPALRKHNPRCKRITTQIRTQSTESPETEPTSPLTDRPDTSKADADTIAARKALSPAYQLYFTCKRCLERSGHIVSKQAYHFGTCIISCPKCKSQHLISDHLKIFGDTKMTLEEIAKQHGEKLRKGRLGLDGDVEFYDEKAEEEIERDEMEKRAKMREVEKELTGGKKGKEGKGESEEMKKREEKEMTERIKEHLKEHLKPRE